MNILIKKAPYLGKNGTLASEVLTQAVVTEVYRVNEASKNSQFNISILNSGVTAVKVKVWVTATDTPELKDMIESNVPLDPDAVYTRTNIIGGAGDAVYAQADGSGVVVRIDGFEAAQK